MFLFTATGALQAADTIFAKQILVLPHRTNIQINFTTLKNVIKKSRYIQTKKREPTPSQTIITLQNITQSQKTRCYTLSNPVKRRIASRPESPNEREY